MPTIIDQAIVLRQWDFSETSQTVALLGRSQGLMRGLAKGAKRPKSAFSGGFETLTLGEVVAIVKPSAELATLTAWDLQEIFWGPRRTLGAHRAGLYMVDLARRAIVDHDPHPKLFDSLAQELRGLDDDGVVDRGLLAFQWTLLREIGLTPRLRAKEIADAGAWLFSPTEGGVVGPASSREIRMIPGAWRVRRETLDLLASLDEQGHASSDSGQPGPRPVARASRLLAEYLRVVLDADLSTRQAIFGPAVHQSAG